MLRDGRFGARCLSLSPDIDEPTLAGRRRRRCVRGGCDEIEDGALRLDLLAGDGRADLLLESRSFHRDGG